MSANYVVDLGATTDYRPSITPAADWAPASGVIVGEIVDLLGANSYCNVWAVGQGSGPHVYQIQTSDGTTSGSFVDATSGLINFPSFVASGGLFVVNSGLAASGFSSLASPINNAPLFCSGGIQFGAFQRTQRYARLLFQSGAGANATKGAGFISQKKFPGSGFGFTYLPTSGTINV